MVHFGVQLPALELRPVVTPPLWLWFMVVGEELMEVAVVEVVVVVLVASGQTPAYGSEFKSWPEKSVKTKLGYSHNTHHYIIKLHTSYSNSTKRSFTLLCAEDLQMNCEKVMLSVMSCYQYHYFLLD